MATDRKDAGAIARARQSAVPVAIMDVASRTDGLGALLAAHDITHIALAGYIRFVPTDVTASFRGRIVNIHPALLPAFGGPGMYGQRVHVAVRAAGVTVTGATVHFVDAAYDHGPIIAQWPVPVFPDDSADDIARRVLDVEHALYPRVVHDVATGRITLGSDDCVQGRPAPKLPFFSLRDAPALPDDLLDPPAS
ncbi:MAG: Phosphoribosylglycinamide formyltransferase [Gemmatimonadaceae bacterium]|nr:Phosphoribosylglycinamide formyltransferase [Gemmatimonadaceae bacterium]